MPQPPKSSKRVGESLADGALQWIGGAVLAGLWGIFFAILHWFSNLGIIAQIALSLLALASLAWLLVSGIMLRDWLQNRKHDLIFIFDESDPRSLKNNAKIRMYGIGIRARNRNLPLEGLSVKTRGFVPVIDAADVRTQLARFQDAPLIMANENSPTQPRLVCDLNPGDEAFFDFMTQIQDQEWAKGVMHFCHAMGIEPYDAQKHARRKRIYPNGTMVRLPTDEIRKTDCLVTLVASAKNAPAKYQDFRISIRSGAIHVEMIGKSRRLPYPPKTAQASDAPIESQPIQTTVLLDARSEAIAKGGLAGARALIQGAIENIPTEVHSINRGAWKAWLTEIDSLLAGLVKAPKRGIELSNFDFVFAGPRRSAASYLRGLINNLTEADLNISANQQGPDGIDGGRRPAQARDQRTGPFHPSAN
jgi:hypothetical protein